MSVAAVEIASGPPSIAPWRMLAALLPIRKGDFSRALTGAGQCGGILSTHFGVVRVVVVTAPEYIEEVLVKNHKCYHKDPGYASLRRVLGNGLLTSEDGFHLRQRRLIQPAFHKEAIACHANDMVALTRDACSHWFDGETRDLNRDLMACTLAIIGKTMFGADVREEAVEVAHALDVFMRYQERYAVEAIGKVFDHLPLKSTRDAHAGLELLDKTIYRMIEAHRSNTAPHGDLLDMLLAAQDTEDGTRMTNTQVRDEAITLFLAGHETTAIALTWTLYLLSEHPSVEAQLHAEVDRVLEGRPAVMADLERLTYTRQVFAESMRLYPPAYGFGRQAIRDNTIGGFRIRKGTIVVISPYVTHRDPHIWPDPERFDPNRWTPEAMEARHKFAYCPFGGGVRKCIGEPFAWMEGILVLATLAQEWKMRLTPGYTPVLDPKITLRVKGGMPMSVHRR